MMNSHTKTDHFPLQFLKKHQLAHFQYKIDQNLILFRISGTIWAHYHKNEPYLLHRRAKMYRFNVYLLFYSANHQDDVKQNKIKFTERPILNYSIQNQIVYFWRNISVTILTLKQLNWQHYGDGRVQVHNADQHGRGDQAGVDRRL